MWQAIYTWLLSWFHVHAWVDESSEVIMRHNYRQDKTVPVGRSYIQKCSTCGKRREQTFTC